MRDIKFSFWYKPGKIWEGRGVPIHMVRVPFGEHENYEVVEFTGLKDKNDVEIYEGDVVKFVGNGGRRQSVVEVKFENQGWFPWATDYDEIHQVDDTCEVIGNIYENPELLTQEDNPLTK